MNFFILFQRIRPYIPNFIVNNLIQFKFFNSIYFTLIESGRKNVAIINGYKMWLGDSDELKLSVYGVFEPQISNIISKILKPGNFVIDVGANIGYYSLLFSKCVGPEGLVISFEPESKNFDLLKKNIEMNNITNISIENTGVSNINGSLPFFLSKNKIGTHSLIKNLEPNRRETQIKVIRLDDFLAAYNRDIDLIKIDIEGAEGFAFEGMELIIKERRVNYIVFEYSPFWLKLADFKPNQVLNRLLHYNYVLFNITQNCARIDRVTDDIVKEKDGEGNTFQIDIIAVKKEIIDNDEDLASTLCNSL